MTWKKMSSIWREDRHKHQWQLHNFGRTSQWSTALTSINDQKTLWRNMYITKSYMESINILYQSRKSWLISFDVAEHRPFIHRRVIFQVRNLFITVPVRRMSTKLYDDYFIRIQQRYRLSNRKQLNKTRRV